MNRRMIVNTVGKMICLEALALLLPMICSIIYQESSYLSFLITIVIALAVGGLFISISKNPIKTIYAKEGFLIVSLI